LKNFQGIRQRRFTRAVVPEQEHCANIRVEVKHEVLEAFEIINGQTVQHGMIIVSTKSWRKLLVRVLPAEALKYHNQEPIVKGFYFTEHQTADQWHGQRE